MTGFAWSLAPALRVAAGLNARVLALWILLVHEQALPAVGSATKLSSQADHGAGHVYADDLQRPLIRAGQSDLHCIRWNTSRRTFLLPSVNNSPPGVLEGSCLVFSN